MREKEKINILLVDDLPAKLLSYEVILQDLGETLIKANSAREALEQLLRNDIAVILVDVCMPDLDGFQLATMIREHPRFKQTAIIFISAIQVTDMDLLRGYETGGVDYVPVPVVPEVLRAKVRVFVELYRKTRELERLNRELERRVEERTAALAENNARLQQSEQRRTLALVAGGMGSWDWDVQGGECVWDEGQYRIYGETPESFRPTPATMGQHVHPGDRDAWQRLLSGVLESGQTCPIELRIVSPDGDVRWCIVAAAATMATNGSAVHVSGVTIDITERKQAEDRQTLLAREVDHRARNALAVVQSIVHLSRADSKEGFVSAVTGRIQALARAHTLLSESRWKGADLLRLVEDEFAPYLSDEHSIELQGPQILLPPATAQALALVLHELLTNAAKYGALAQVGGGLSLQWAVEPEALILEWRETARTPVSPPSQTGFGTKLIRTTVERGLKGGVEYSWRSEGLLCRLHVPVAADIPVGQVTADTISGTPAPPDPPQQRTYRIMLVEDESMIALMMQEMLAELGCAVVGPFADIDAAMQAAREEPIDAALLDVNVAGRPVYGIADALTTRGIPIILMTGYDSHGIEPRYAATRALQKPVDPDLFRRMLASLLVEAAAPARAAMR